MCRIAFVKFSEEVRQKRRHSVLTTVLKNSWDLDNKDGVGFVSWDTKEEPQTGKSLTLDGLTLPRHVGSNVLVHARHATCPVTMENTHPMVGAETYLIHNGIVTARGKEDKEVLDKMTHTTNDSELILKAYLVSGRNLYAALDMVGGWANVMLWDQRREVMSVFADGSDFHMWRQDGVMLLIQEDKQKEYIVHGGLGSPYEYGVLKADHVYEFMLNKQPTFDAALAAARKCARTKTLPSASYIQRTVSDELGSGPYAYQGYTANGYGTYPYPRQTQIGGSATFNIAPSGVQRGVEEVWKADGKWWVRSKNGPKYPGTESSGTGGGKE